MKYKSLSDLPLEMRETNKDTLYPQHKVIELLEKSNDRQWYIEHFDQSIPLLDNIRKAIEIYSDGRITF